MLWSRHLIATSIIGLLAAGCATPGSQGLPFAVTRIPNVDRSAAFEAARLALVDLGYTIEQANPSTGQMKTAATTETRRPSSEREPVRLSAPPELRRVIEIRVRGTQDSVNVYCQVAIQELETETHRIMQQQLNSSDRTGETAIDRDAGTTIEQNSVWRTIHRDRAEERNILDTIQNHLNASLAAPADGAAGS